MKALKSLIENDHKLRELINISAVPDTFMAGLSASSQNIQPGFLFVARRGAAQHSRDGHDFIDDAIARGAIAVVVNHDFSSTKKYSVPIILAKNSRLAFCFLAEAFYGYPSRSLKIIGITGTNGKTSSSFMLHSILKNAGHNPKIMGTLGMGDPGRLLSFGLTTPEPDFISASLKGFVDAGVSHVIMEVSSHALSQKRVDALTFCAVAITNISDEHLDFHDNFANYLAAKKRLFFDLASPTTKIILPDEAPLVEWHRELKNVELFGAQDKSSYQYFDDTFDLNKMSFTLRIKKHSELISLNSIGDFQKKNAALAAGLADALAIDHQSIFNGLAESPAVPGRMQSVPNNNGPTIIIDFAHTPDALLRLLLSAKKLTTNHLYVVFGCGGDRCHKKRAAMGKIAETVADHIIITDDNPRTEDPQKIRAEIASGIEGTHFHDIGDRKEAIKSAINRAGKNDVVVIAGKGHEDYQIIGQKHLPFSDFEEAKKAVESL